jgi:uncharacterized protein YndB with AHSA1/START domain
MFDREEKVMSVTTNQPSVVDSNSFTVRRTITVKAPIEKVWAAITEEEHLARWFPHNARLEPVAVGAGGVFTWDGYGSFPVVVEEINAPTMIAYRWNNASDPTAPATAGDVDPAQSTVFRFTLEAAPEGTRLTVVETGFDRLENPGASMESNRGGWNSELDELVAYLEGGS